MVCLKCALKPCERVGRWHREQKGRVQWGAAWWWDQLRLHPCEDPQKTVRRAHQNWAWVLGQRAPTGGHLPSLAFLGISHLPTARAGVRPWPGEPPGRAIQEGGHRAFGGALGDTKELQTGHRRHLAQRFFPSFRKLRKCPKGTQLAKREPRLAARPQGLHYGLKWRCFKASSGRLRQLKCLILQQLSACKNVLRIPFWKVKWWVFIFRV